MGAHDAVVANNVTGVPQHEGFAEMQKALVFEFCQCP